MRTSKRNISKQSHKRIIIVAVVVLVLLLVSGGAYALYNTGSTGKTSTDTNSSGDSQQIENADQPQATTDKGAPVSEAYTAPTSTDSIGISAESVDGSVVIRTTLKGYSDGTCTLKMTSGTKEYTKNADVLFTPNQSLCAGFTVPLSELSAGTWEIRISVTSGGTTTTNSIQYEVAR